MLFANLRFTKAINKMAKVKSMLNNIGVIKICSHMGTTLHKRLSYIALDLKVASATFLLVCFLSLKESICETRKNIFYFTSKALFFLEKNKF